MFWLGSANHCINVNPHNSPLLATSNQKKQIKTKQTKQNQYWNHLSTTSKAANIVPLQNTLSLQLHIIFYEFAVGDKGRQEVELVTIIFLSLRPSLVMTVGCGAFRWPQKSQQGAAPHSCCDDCLLVGWKSDVMVTYWMDLAQCCCYYLAAQGQVERRAAKKMKLFPVSFNSVLVNLSLVLLFFWGVMACTVYLICLHVFRCWKLEVTCSFISCKISNMFV